MDLTGGLSVDRCVPAEQEPTGLAEPALVELVYPRCGASACLSPSYFLDAHFDGTECKPYSFSGMETHNYCYGENPITLREKYRDQGPKEDKPTAELNE